MLVIIDGIKKDIHYSIAKRLIENGQAIAVTEVDKEKKEKFDKKVVKNQGKKK
jgi:enoyl-[acyl-carrier-protein] reductase (NADH)